MTLAAMRKIVRLRKRGIGLIETVLTIGVGLGLIAGGVSYYETADRQRVVTDLYSSFAYVQSTLESDVSRGARLPLGSLATTYNLVPMPGFTVQAGGAITHDWSRAVELRHMGEYVVSFALEDVTPRRCASLMMQAIDQARDSGYKSIARVNTSLFAVNNADAVHRIVEACRSGATADVGWIYAPTVRQAVERTGLTLVAGTMEPVQEEGAEDVPEVVVPDTSEDGGDDLLTGGDGNDGGADTPADPPADTAGGSEIPDAETPVTEPPVTEPPVTGTPDADTDAADCGTSDADGPGNSEYAPGQTGEPPGQSGALPPGQSGAAPGKSKCKGSNGNSANAPGHTGENPGQSGALPPGQADTVGNSTGGTADSGDTAEGEPQTDATEGEAVPEGTKDEPVAEEGAAEDQDTTVSGWPSSFVDREFEDDYPGILVPPSLKKSSKWGSEVTSQKFNAPEGMKFRISGAGSPVAQDANDDYAANGAFGKKSTIRYAAPSCGATSTLFLELESGIRYILRATRPAC